MSALLQFLRRLSLLLPLLLLLEAPAATGPVRPAQFLPGISAQLSAHFAVSGELQLDLLRPWTPPPLASGEWEMNVVVPPQSLGPQIIVRVRLTQAGRSVGEWNLPLGAQLWADALTARQPLLRGDLLDRSLCDFRRTDFIRERDAVPAGADLSGLTVARPLSTGDTLTWRDVAKRALVQRGDRVEVVASSGSLLITMKALALQSGALGDTIVVRNPESRKDFSAVVTAENQARVSF